MYPKETSTFSTPPDRDGTNAQLGPDANGNGGVYTGGGEKTVALVDNVRDDNFYDFPAAPTYIAGFFSSQFNELVDRNVMTIDAFDWLHRTTANPAGRADGRPLHEPPGAPEPLRGHVRARVAAPPALLHRPVRDDVDERGDRRTIAQTLTGYVDATATVFDRGADSHIYCFQGFGTVQTPFNPNPRDCGGPENSLNLWGEAQPERGPGRLRQRVLDDAFLVRPLRPDIITRLHNDGELQGLAEPRRRAEGRGAPRACTGDPRLPVDGPARQDRR